MGRCNFCKYHIPRMFYGRELLLPTCAFSNPEYLLVEAYAIFTCEDFERGEWKGVNNESDIGN